jgi:diguanylate cyclase (GGDEF)-like protein
MTGEHDEGRHLPRPPLLIALAYAAIATAWITASDWMLAGLWPDQYPLLGLYKGWAFVAVTAVLLYAALRREDDRRTAVEQKLRKLAHHDPLTGLLNRHCFSGHLERALARAARDGSQIGVLFVDLDGFKTINDHHGHHVGDCVLGEVASRLKQSTRAADTVARLGGDEFVIMVANGRRGAERVRDRLTAAISAPIKVEGAELWMSASVGCAFYPDNGMQGTDLLHAADMDMYRVKNGPRRH